MPRIEIKEIKDLKLKNPTIIEGFPGIGMIGTICASYMAEKLEMELVGYFASTHFPPIAAIHDYKPVSPARIYASKKHNLIILFSEFVIPAEVVFSLSEKVLEYAKKKKAKAIYSLAGIASEQPQAKIYGIASTPKMADLMKKGNVELIKEGATQGVSGVLIAECATQQFDAANILIQTNLPLDPRSSAILLKKLADITGIKVDTQGLENEGDKIEAKLKDAFEKMKTMNTSYKEIQNDAMYS
jgi:uncharacterized protein